MLELVQVVVGSVTWFRLFWALRMLKFPNCFFGCFELDVWVLEGRLLFWDVQVPGCSRCFAFFFKASRCVGVEYVV